MSKNYYKDAFAIDEVPYNIRKLEEDSISEPFQLNSYNYYEPKLESDFYIKYFTYILLFDTDILEVKDLLQYQYDYCDNPDLYFSILDCKITPKIKEIIENAVMNIVGAWNEEGILEDGFFETDGIIKNSKYEYSIMLHKVSYQSLQNDLKKRIEIITSFLTTYMDKHVVKPLKWIAGPSQLGIIVRELIDMGYMEADMRRGEINNSSLSRDLLKAFSFEGEVSVKSIEIYLSPGNKRYINAKELFDEKGFSIPPAKYTN